MNDNIKDKTQIYLSWEDTIKHIRSQSEYASLVKNAYLDEDLEQNVNNYSKSDEFIDTMRIIQQYFPDIKQIKLIDIGCGNGTSAISFALKGMHVHAIEPDESETVGTKAILKLKNIFHLNNIKISKAFGEQLPVKDNSVDIVYIRQTLHHASNLNQFCNEVYRVLKPNGIFFATREHILNKEEEKPEFLKKHPLHKFYGGENAFTLKQYKEAISNSGLTLIEILKLFDNPINYFPKIEQVNSKRKKLQRLSIIKRNFKFLSKFYLFKIVLNYLGEKNLEAFFDETKYVGRLNSFIAQKTKIE